MNLVYADNKAVFGRSFEEVARSYEALCAAVSDQKLPIHEKTGVINEGEFLGVKINGVEGYIGPTEKRVWRVKQAFDYLSKRPRVSGEDVLHLVGHATYLFLFNRPLLSIFRHLYDFAASLGSQRAKLWSGAAEEARVRNLVGLTRCSLRRVWQPRVFCSVEWRMHSMGMRAFGRPELVNPTSANASTTGRPEGRL